MPIQKTFDRSKNFLAQLIFALTSKLLLRNRGLWGLDAKRPKHQILALKVVGQIYRYGKVSGEYLRIWLFTLHEKVSSNWGIFKELLYHSRSFIVFTLIVVTASLLPLKGWGFLLTRDVIIGSSTAYAAGATALLGIVFALYAVGFQVTTAKFSSKVTDYLNRERVGQFFFALLTLTVIFSLATLLLQQGTEEKLVTAFIVNSFFMFISLAGLLIFKDDYITKLKPRQTFERLYNQILKSIRQVNKYDYPEFDSFKITRAQNAKSGRVYPSIHSSWSIVTNLQRQVRDRLSIIEVFYDELIKDDKPQDAMYGLSLLGQLLAEYTSVKHFIDKDFGWWFPDKQEIVKADNSTTFAIKANYESKGIGRLAVTKKDFDWVEDTIIAFFTRVQKNTDFQRNPELGQALIFAYEIAISGDFSKTNKGLEKLLRGCFENQYNEIASKIFALFVDLGEKVCSVEGCRTNYLNAMGTIKTIIADGFSLRSFPGHLEHWSTDLEARIKEVISGVPLVSQQRMISWKMPKEFFSSLTLLRKRLQTEYEIEGRMVSPPVWLTKDVMDELRRTENEISLKHQDEVVEAVIRLSKFCGFYRDHFVMVILDMFNQLIYADNWAAIDRLLTKFDKQLLTVLLSIPKDQFIENGLREQIEFGVFNSLIVRKKAPFLFYLKLFYLSQIRLSADITTRSLTDQFKTLRRPIMLGSLAYLVSELDQDFSYVTSFTVMMEKLYPRVSIADLYSQVIDYRSLLGSVGIFEVSTEEFARYRIYYRQVINPITDLPRRSETSGSIPYGFHTSEMADHPSSFVRDISQHEFSDMEECHEGYVGWLKKRELMKKFITLLSNA